MEDADDAASGNDQRRVVKRATMNLIAVEQLLGLSSQNSEQSRCKSMKASEVNSLDINASREPSEVDSVLMSEAPQSASGNTVRSNANESMHSAR